MGMIEENLRQVQDNIRFACQNSGRDPEEVRLIAVSKTKPLEMLWEAYDAGVRDFGENKVQELLDKIPQMPSDIRWHMIGHLQSNKIKYIIDKVCLIHGVDSVHLAEEISREALKRGLTVDILVEVNIAAEESKYGFPPEQTADALEQILPLPGIRVRGLMAIAPMVENGEQNREYFRKLKQLSVDITRKNVDNRNMGDVLSMGMTGDYIAAVEEGATYIRVGTGIFGERRYEKEN